MSPRRLNARHFALLNGDAGDFGLLVDVDAAHVGLMGIAPDNSVMANNAAGWVVEGSQNRVARVVADIYGRA